MAVETVESVECDVLLGEGDITENEDTMYAPSRSASRWRRFMGFSVVVSIGVGLAGVSHRAFFQVASPVASHDSIMQLVEKEAGHDLNKDTDFEYTDLAGIGHVDNIGSAEQCCTVCKGEPTCKAFTWVLDAHLPSGDPGQCWLKGGSFVRTNLVRGVFSAFVRDDAASAKADAERVEKIQAEQQKKQAEATTKATTSTALATTSTVTTVTKTQTTTSTLTITTTENPCAGRGAGCMDKKCCSDAGFQCLTKDPYWAQCMDTCTPGINPYDQVSNDPWQCAALGDKTPGEPEPCATDSENCMHVKCCKTPGFQCFGKNGTWGMCKASCSPGPDLAAANSDPWTCEPHGGKALGMAPWVPETCAQEGADCHQVGCCAQPGMVCCKQNEYWAQCSADCKESDKLGVRTPEPAVDPDVKKGQVR